MNTYTITYVVVTDADSEDEAIADARDCIMQPSWEPASITVEEASGS